MKTLLFITIGLSLTASAQNTPFVHSVQRKTNVTNVAASGVIAAHTITTVAEIAFVGVATDKGIVTFDQPAVRLVSQVTNLVDKVLVQKPSRALPVLPKQTTPGPQSLNIVKPASLVVNTNSPAYRRAHKLPPFDK